MDEEMYGKALICSEIIGDDLYDLLKQEKKPFEYWVSCCEKRFNEEINRRMETGICMHFKDLYWTIPGNKGWPHYPEKHELPFC